MVKLKLDHLVHAVMTPEEAAESFASRFRWRTVPGGEHKNWGTYNSLAYFGLSYVEWIGVRDPQVAQASHFGRQIVESLKQAEGVSQLALRTENMDELIETWKAQGIPFLGPENGSRVRPNGETIRWRLLYPKTDDGTSYRFPFVIEWGESDKVRQVLLQDLRAADDNVSGVHAVVHSVNHIQEQFETYFGWLPVTVSEDDDYRRMEIRLSDSVLCFWEPRLNAPSRISQEWREYLERTGERTVQLDLDSAAVGAAEASVLRSPQETQGAFGLRFSQETEGAPALKSPQETLHGLAISKGKE